jgi:hypothetical protein
MGSTAILFPAAKAETAKTWLARAAQARRVAAMLGPVDAAILEVFALECEAKSEKPVTAQSIAA